MPERAPAVKPSDLDLRIQKLELVSSRNTKIVATFDLSIAGLVTILDCRLVNRHNKDGRTVYGPSIQNPATATYPRFVRFEAEILEYITTLAEQAYAAATGGLAESDSGE